MGLRAPFFSPNTLPCYIHLTYFVFTPSRALEHTMDRAFDSLYSPKAVNSVVCTARIPIRGTLTADEK